MKVTKGDIVYLREEAYQKKIGNIQGGFRPMIVVSNDKGNHFGNICIISPLTAHIKNPHFPCHALIHGDTKKSMVLCEQLFTVNQSDIERIAGHCSDSEMKDIERALKISLGIR